MRIEGCLDDKCLEVVRKTLIMPESLAHTMVVINDEFTIQPVRILCLPSLAVYVDHPGFLKSHTSAVIAGWDTEVGGGVRSVTMKLSNTGSSKIAYNEASR
jgi:hypothetical protein